MARESFTSSSVHGPLCTSSVFPNPADWLPWTTVHSEWRQLEQSSFVGGLQGNPPQPGKIELTATSDIQEEEDGRTENAEMKFPIFCWPFPVRSSSVLIFIEIASLYLVRQLRFV